MTNTPRTMMYTFEDIIATLGTISLAGFTDGGIAIQTTGETVTETVGTDSTVLNTFPRFITNKGMATLTFFSNSPLTKQIHELYMKFKINENNQVVNGVKLYNYIAGSVYNASSGRLTTAKFIPNKHTSDATYASTDGYVSLSFILKDIIDEYKVV